MDVEGGCFGEIVEEITQGVGRIGAIEKLPILVMRSPDDLASLCSLAELHFGSPDAPSFKVDPQPAVEIAEESASRGNDIPW